MPGTAGPEKFGESTLRFSSSDSATEIARRLQQDRLIIRATRGLCVEHPDLSQVKRILDVGCGPGGWALEVAFAYPESEVVGIDQSRAMVDYAQTQAAVQQLHNASFKEMDIAEPLAFNDNAFEIVNARFLGSQLTRDQWSCTVQEFVRVAAPGGIVRLTESDAAGMSNSAALTRLSRLYAQRLADDRHGYFPLAQADHLCITPQLDPILRQAGCVDIREQPYALNFSVGKASYSEMYQNIRVAYKMSQPLLVDAGMISQEEADELYEQMLMEMLSDNFCALWYMLAVWGYKPD
jgi:ubiquinone/menaquinone biosynthesis C-methylase UbiE